MDFPPDFLDIRDQPCLVVGGGEAAAHKSALLLRAGARDRANGRCNAGEPEAPEDAGAAAVPFACRARRNVR